MPTVDEWQELLDNTTSEWTTVDGVNGRRFTSDANGNSIFLPATGNRFDQPTPDGEGESGYYWSSSLYTDNPSRAWYGSFASSGVGKHHLSRNLGLSVRPVHE